MQFSYHNSQGEPYRQPQTYSSLGQRYQVGNNKDSKDTELLFKNSADTGQEYYIPQPQLNRYGQSQIQQVFAPLPPQQPVSNPNKIQQPQKVLKSSYQIQKQAPQEITTVQSTQYQRPKSSYDKQVNANRYDSYIDAGPHTYKYNLFSAFDQPYNRCRMGQSCSKTSGNECIAQSKHTRYMFFQ